MGSVGLDPREDVRGFLRRDLRGDGSLLRA